MSATHKWPEPGHYQTCYGVREIREDGYIYRLESECVGEVGCYRHQECIPIATPPTIESLTQRVAELDGEVERYRTALDALYRKLCKVHADPHYEAVWTTAQNHLGPYCGESYASELQAAYEALNPKAEQ